MNMSTTIAPVFSAKDLNQLNYVDLAQKVIEQHYQKEGKKTITTNQIRNFLELTNELREQLRTDHVEKLTPEMMSQVQYIKLRLIYATGRDKEGKGVFEFMQRSSLIECLDTVGDSPQQYLLVCRYLEALTAYHKWYETKKELDAAEEYANKRQNQRRY